MIRPPEASASRQPPTRGAGNRRVLFPELFSPHPLSVLCQIIDLELLVV